MRQPIIYVENTVVEDKIIVIVFIIFIILTIVLYFSRYLLQAESAPISITKAQMDLIENKTGLPEGLQNQTFLTTGNNFLNPKNLTLGNLELLSGLDECPEGECAIDLKTGVKRCPQDNNIRLVYNRAFEGCSARFNCTLDKLPYAILSSGETDTFGVCEKNIECRCSSEIVCPKYVVSSFNLINFSDSDYYFDQTTLGDEKIMGYDSIVIPQESTATQFCNINPSYSERITGGFNFVNGDNDILGCLNSQDFLKISVNKFNNDITSNFPLAYQNTVGSDGTYNKNPVQYQSYLNIDTPDKPEKGYVSYMVGDNLQIMSYDNIDKNSKTINNSNVSTVSNLTSTAYNPSDQSVSIDLGTTSDISSSKFMNIIYTGCSDVSGVFISNNNMLLATQTSNQPCFQGLFSYIVDTKPASQFCQTLDEYTKNGGRFNRKVLDDPQNFTLSCVTGPGCNGDYGQSFCKDGDCTQAIDQYKFRFQDFDTSALNGSWLIKNLSTPSPGVISFTYTVSGGIILKNNGLLIIEPGDYFSTVKQKYQKILNESVLVADENTFLLGSVNGLQVGYNVFVTGYKGSIKTINVDQNKIVVTKISSTVDKIPIYSLIDFYKQVKASGDGQDFGRLIVRDDGTIFPATIKGIQSQFSSTPETIFVFKQFGFNGLNYNTKFVYNEGIIYRQYSKQSQWYYWLSDIINVVPDGDLLMAPLGPDVVPLSIFLNDQKKTISRANINGIVFSSPEADFKQDLSLYYPVWDKSKNNQVCIRCTPLLYTYLKIDDNANVTSAVIQFSGKDFYQYMYYPQITQKVGNNFFILTDPQTSAYIFNFLTSISQTEISTDRRIVLDSVNPNLPFSSGDYYLDNPHYILDSNNIIRRQVFMVDNSIFDVVNIAPDKINIGKIQLSDEMLEVNVIPDDWKSFYYDDQELVPDSTVQFSLSGNSYTNYTRKDDSNWFSGKSYFYDGIRLIVQGQVKITKVELINGKQVIYTDSITSLTIPKNRNVSNPTILQIYSTQDVLDLDFDRSLVGSDGKTQTVIVDSITDGRITNLSFPVVSNANVDIQALPSIIFKKYRNLL